MNSLSLTLAAVAGLALVGPSQAQEVEADAKPPAYITLEYRVVTTRTPTIENVERRKPLVPRTERNTTITLGPRIVELRSAEGSRLVLDYESGRQLLIDDGAGTYRSAPLIARFGFIEMESFNRQRMGSMLAAAGVSDPSFEPLELAILFGRPHPDDGSEIVRKIAEDGTTWSVGDDELTRMSASEHALDEEQLGSLTRVLHWRCKLHPDVRQGVVDAGHVPAELRYRWHDTGQRAVSTWTLTGCTRTTTAPVGVEELQRVFDDDVVGRLARRALRPADDTPGRIGAEDLARLAAEAREAGRAVDAALLLLESSLQENADVGSSIRELMSDPGHAAAVRGVMQSITRANTEPENGIAELDAIDRTQLTHPAILDVFRANGLARLGRTTDSLEAFESALTALPWLTSAYKDLGMVLHQAFRAREAWLAWEIGRTIHVDHPMWQGIDELEEKLRAEYGELL